MHGKCDNCGSLNYLSEVFLITNPALVKRLCPDCERLFAEGKIELKQQVDWVLKREKVRQMFGKFGE